MKALRTHDKINLSSCDL